MRIILCEIRGPTSVFIALACRIVPNNDRAPLAPFMPAGLVQNTIKKTKKQKKTLFPAD